MKLIVLFYILHLTQYNFFMNKNYLDLQLFHSHAQAHVHSLNDQQWDNLRHSSSWIILLTLPAVYGLGTTRV